MDNNGGNNNMNESGGPKDGPKTKTNADSMLDEVLNKIQDADSVLVALSNDPTVDEIAAAMGLSMALDAVGKHVTAIYSGKTPNVLEFLKPQERFETGTESLQDFVIALNKDKADHLRYKIDGDFVKVYVTPYKTTISGDDLEFSRGDYNVDLVIALNVPAASELDAALSEHGRIMHDATSVNITNGAEGDFGDVQWVDSNASSISEMVSKLVFALDEKMDPSTATALLTGLVAATDRFKNPETTPDAMVLAAKLMGAGADQQLVVQNVQGEVVFNGEAGGGKNVVVPGTDGEDSSEDATKLDIKHGEGDDGSEDEKEVEIASAEIDGASDDKKEETETIQTGGAVLEPLNTDFKADEAETEDTDTKTDDAEVGGTETVDSGIVNPESGVDGSGPETVDANGQEGTTDGGMIGSAEPAPGDTSSSAPVAEETSAASDGLSPETSGIGESDNNVPAPEVEVGTPVAESAPTKGNGLNVDNTLAQGVSEAPVPEEAQVDDGSNDPVKAAMAEAMETVQPNTAVNNGTVAGVDVAVVPSNADGYVGGELADQILNNIEKETSNVGATDYGKMIDEALNEPLPGEGGIQVGENGVNGPKVDTQDVDKADVPEGNLMAMVDNEGDNPSTSLGAQMMANAGTGLNDNKAGGSAGGGMMPVSSDMNPSMIPPKPTDGMSEAEALDLIQHGKEEAETNAFGPQDSGEAPKIITGSSMELGEQPVGADDGGLNTDVNPAMAQTPGMNGVEASGVPDMNFQGMGDVDTNMGEASSAMPLPGQEMVPPPMTPMPDFGAMPPTTPDMPAAQVENPLSVPEDASLMSQAKVQPDMNMPMNGPSAPVGADLPQMPQVMGGDNMGAMGAMGAANTFQTPNPMGSSSTAEDAGAFKIPGIHT